MSVHINLPPHREERRKRGRQHFAVLAGLTAALGIVIVGAGYLYISRLITTQEERNAFLKSEIAKLDKTLADPLLFTNDPAKGSAVSKKRADAVRKLEAAEKNWMAAQEEYDAAMAAD